jgi:hypothetical protein
MKQKADQGDRTPRDDDQSSKKKRASSRSRKLGPTTRARLDKLARIVDDAASIPFPSNPRRYTRHTDEGGPDDAYVYWRSFRGKVRTPLKLISQMCQELRFKASATEADRILKLKDPCDQLLHLKSYLVPACRVEIAKKRDGSAEAKRVIYKELSTVITAMEDICSRPLTDLGDEGYCDQEPELFLRLSKTHSLFRRFKVPELWAPFEQLPPAETGAISEMLPLLRLSVLPDCRSELDRWARKNEIDLTSFQAAVDERGASAPAGAQPENTGSDLGPAEEGRAGNGAEESLPAGGTRLTERPDDRPFLIGEFQFHPKCHWVKHKGAIYRCATQPASAALRFLTDQHLRGNTPVRKWDVCKAVVEDREETFNKETNAGEHMIEYFKNNAEREWIYRNVIARKKSGWYGVNERPEPQ